MELIEAKISAMIALGLGSLLVGLLPALFSSRGKYRWPLFLSSLLCFGAGVLLSTSLVHMLPEVREAMPKYKEYVELVFCGGFFLVYFVDEVVHLFYGDANVHDRNTLAEDHFPTQRLGRRHSANGGSYGALETQALLYQDYAQRQQPYNPNFTVGNTNAPLNEAPPSQLCHVGHQQPCSATHIGIIGLLAALSVHAVLEGLAVGLESSTSQVLLMLAAVASHKLVVAFCLGAELSSSRQSTACRHFVSIIIFSFGSVLGIGLGMVITEIPKKVSEVVLPILQGLAGGTLLYVTVSEVLPRERARWHQQHSRKSAGLLQFVSVAIGFSAMTAVTRYLDH